MPFFSDVWETTTIDQPLAIPFMEPRLAWLSGQHFDKDVEYK
jgi:hypothetical protein